MEEEEGRSKYQLVLAFHWPSSLKLASFFLLKYLHFCQYELSVLLYWPISKYSRWTKGYFELYPKRYYIIHLILVSSIFFSIKSRFLQKLYDWHIINILGHKSCNKIVSYISYYFMLVYNQTSAVLFSMWGFSSIEQFCY